MTSTNMTSYERIRTALHHQEPDRIPFDIGATAVTGINIHLYKKLRNALGLPELEPEVLDVTQQLGKVDEDVKAALNIDVSAVFPGAPSQNTNIKPIEKGDRYFTRSDEWGIQWKMPVENGHYFDMVGHPLTSVTTPEELDKYNWPNPTDDAIFETMKPQADKIVYEEKRAAVIGSGPGIWELALWTNGFEKFFSEMAANKRYAHAVMRKLTDYKLAYWKKALDVLGENILVAYEADDLATQKSLLVSPRMYKELIHPYHKELYNFIHSYAKNEVFVFYHSCGACKPLIPLLIEEGVNILNPVQVSATGMDTAELKKEFGKDITFWGGGVDTQHVLPFGTEAEVKDEVRRRIDDLAKDGGFVFAAIHNVQSDVPVQNLMAMWNALQEYGRY